MNLRNELVKNLVSVVIPAFNCSNFIEEAVDSVLNQSYKNIEIIVIDDGSTDNTLDIMRAFGNEIQIYSQENNGISVARNLGILNSTGEYVAFLDADDKWKSDKLQKDLDFLNSGPFDYIVSPGFLWYENELQLSFASVGKLERIEGLLEFCLSNPGYDPYLVSSMVIRRLSLSKTGLYNPEIREQGEAYDFHLRVLQHLSGIYRDEPSFFYRQHPASVSRKPKKNYFVNNRKAVNAMMDRNAISLAKKIKIRLKLEKSFIKSSIKDFYSNNLR